MNSKKERISTSYRIPQDRLVKLKILSKRHGTNKTKMLVKLIDDAYRDQFGQGRGTNE